MITLTLINDVDDPQRYYVITYPNVPNHHPFREKLREHSYRMNHPMTEPTTGQVEYPPIGIPELPFNNFLSIQGVGKYKRKNCKSRKSRKSKRRSKRSV